MEKKIDKKYINEKDLSTLTGRALQTLRNDRFLGRGFPYIKLGRSIRYDLEQAIAIMESHKVATASFSQEQGQALTQKTGTLSARTDLLA